MQYLKTTHVYLEIKFIWVSLWLPFEMGALSPAAGVGWAVS